MLVCKFRFSMVFGGLLVWFAAVIFVFISCCCGMMICGGLLALLLLCFWVWCLLTFMGLVLLRWRSRCGVSWSGFGIVIV